MDYMFPMVQFGKANSTSEVLKNEVNISDY